MDRVLRVLIFGLLTLALGVSSAGAGKRVALVIGNDSYKTLPDLNNARKDAQDIASKLQELGWDVILKTNAKRREIHRGLAEFQNKTEVAQVGLIFFAGHGIEAVGSNFLIPSDAEIEMEADLPSEGINLASVLDKLNESELPLYILIVDACHDNPLPKRLRSAKRGLVSPMISEGIRGIRMFFSAASGQTAQDGPPGCIECGRSSRLKRPRISSVHSRGVNRTAKVVWHPPQLIFKLRIRLVAQ